MTVSNMHCQASSISLLNWVTLISATLVCFASASFSFSNSSSHDKSKLENTVIKYSH